MNRYYTVHIHPDAAPVLLHEGFSWGALCFGPLWLAWHRTWIAAAISTAACVLILTLTAGLLAALLMLTLASLLGLSGHDLRRWSMDHRGYLLATVIAARNHPEALGRLLVRRPDLARRFLPAEQL